MDREYLQRLSPSRPSRKGHSASSPASSPAARAQPLRKRAALAWRPSPSHGLAYKATPDASATPSSSSLSTSTLSPSTISFSAPTSAPGTTSSPQEEYSDRFIPSRAATDWSGAGLHFDVACQHSDNFSNSSGAHTTSSPSADATTSTSTSEANTTDPSRATYNMLLRNELLGASLHEHSPQVSPAAGPKPASREREPSAASTLPGAAASSSTSTSSSPGGSAGPHSRVTLRAFGAHTRMLPTTQQPARSVPGRFTLAEDMSDAALAAASTQADGENLFRFKASPAGSPGRGASGRLGASALPPSAFSLSPMGSDSQRLLQAPRSTPRRIPKVPYKVLDAPDLSDDFYLNLVDWSSQNVLSVGLGSCVYLWSACTSQVTKLCDLRGDHDTITSVSWMQRGSHLAVGTNRGLVQIWDAQRCKLVRTMVGHTGRVGTMAWNSNVLCSGSRDRLILQRDIRAPQPFTTELAAHKQEVCGLQWSPDEQHLASGGNDNKLLVWNPAYSTPVQRFNEHTAAVKAIAWSPHQHGLLASGGGTADQCIRFWNTLTSQPLQCVDTKSQVCNLAWSKNSNELVSTHGYSQNQIAIWKYPSMTQVATLTGHTYRVLYLAMSPDGQTIVTGAGDETLRFWQVFGKEVSRQEKPSILGMFTHIR